MDASFFIYERSGWVDAGAEFKNLREEQHQQKNVTVREFEMARAGSSLQIYIHSPVSQTKSTKASFRFPESAPAALCRNTVAFCFYLVIIVQTLIN
jgi:hypothetical protein